MLPGAKCLTAITVATWNTEWRKASSADAGVIRERLAAIQPEVVCLTESHTDFLAPWDGHTVHSTDAWGGPTFGSRRQVVLWSKNPWRRVDTCGSLALPPGRFVAAVTDTSLGEVAVVGVVIPFHMSNVRYGTRDRTMWELHRHYLDGLPQITSALPAASLVMGDFNQRLGSSWVPKGLRDRLHQAFANHDIVTGGALPPVDAAAIDHIAIGNSFDAKKIWAISNFCGERQVSDHFGVCAAIGTKANG